MSSPDSNAPPIGPDDTVITPSGKPARVVAVHATGRWNEATVQWNDGDRGRFRVMVLRPTKEPAK